MTLLEEFRNMRLNEGEDTDEYIMRLTNSKISLEELGETITYSAVMGSRLLAGLPQSDDVIA